MTILRNAHILTMNEKMTEYTDGFLAFDEKGIIGLGDEKEFPEEWACLPSEDLHHDLVLPSLINTHTHMGMVSFRSLGDDCPDRLHRFLMPLEDRAMNRELAVCSSKMAMAEMMLSGISSAVDMYYFEADVARAAAQLGFRLWAGETLLDKPHCDADSFEASLERTEETIAACGESPLTIPIVAPHAPYSLSLEHLKDAFSFAKERHLLWTTHLSEMAFEVETLRKDQGKTPVGWLSANGLLDDSLLAAHLLLLTEEDIDLLSGSGVSAAHCPGSNAKAAKGVAPALKMIDRDINVTLATDGPASGNALELFTTLRLCAILQKNLSHDRSVAPARNIVPLATRNAGIALRRKIGVLKEGWESDILVLSMSRPNMIPSYDPYSVLVYSAGVQNVQDLYIAGVRKVRDGMLTDIDLDELETEFSSVSEPFHREAMKLSRN
jgi:5-methylthioadenosine/S-adenosylhomocysteine deaminase